MPEQVWLLIHGDRQERDNSRQTLGIIRWNINPLEIWSLPIIQYLPDIRVESERMNRRKIYNICLVEEMVLFMSSRTEVTLCPDSSTERVWGGAIGVGRDIN